MAHKILTAQEQQQAQDQAGKENNHFRSMEGLRNQINDKVNELNALRIGPDGLRTLEGKLKIYGELLAHAKVNTKALIFRVYGGIPYGIAYDEDHRDEAISAIGNDMKGIEAAVAQIKVQEKFAKDKLEELQTALNKMGVYKWQ